MRGLAIQLMGPFHVTQDGQPVTSFEYDKVRALLAYLAVEQERPHRREALAGLLWPDQAEEAAESSVRNALSRLRRVIGDHQASSPYLVANRETIQFNPSSDHWLDVRRFNELLEACQSHRHRRIEACPTCTDRLLDAANLYHGELMEGFSLPNCEPFEDWLRIRRDEVRQLAMEALEKLVATYEWRGEPEKALTYTRRQFKLDTSREETYTQAMRLYATMGKQKEACKQYEKCKHLLSEELGVEPAEETTHLYEQIKYGVFQPTFRHSFRINNLPANLTSFVGREQEIREINALIRDPACRLLTLVGPGGVGKTRLAIAAAAQQQGSFPNGACFVSLAGVGSAEGIVPAILQALELKPASDPKKALVDYLRERDLLIILDNFEHLVKGAEIIIQLLQAALGIMVLVTSRQRLGLQAEWLFEVSGLSYPSGKETRNLAAYEAVLLFTQRLHQLKPRHTLFEDDLLHVSRICRVVEGFPLGIELAAAAVRTKTIEQVASAIEIGKEDLKSSWRDVPERHRSIRAVFEHSYRMLNAEERAAFCGVGVFRAGFSAEAAERVAGATPEIMDILVEHSLVRYEATRNLYQMHELVRQFARDKLKESPQKDQELHQRHSQYFIQALKNRDTAMYSSQLAMVLKELDQHQPDNQAAWDWVCQRQDLVSIRQGHHPLFQYYFFRNRMQEGDHACNQALQAVEEYNPGNSQAKLLEMVLLYNHFEFSKNLHHEIEDELEKRRWENFLRLPDEMRQAGEDIGDAKVKLIMERSAWETDVREKFRLAHESVDLARELGDERSLALILNNLALMEQYSGKSSEAEVHCRETVMHWRKLDVPFHVLRCLSWLSEITAHLGKLEDARQAAEECLAISYSLGTPQNIIDGLQAMAYVCYCSRKWDEASNYYAESLPYIQETGDQNRLCPTLASWAEVKMLSGFYDEARVMAQESYSLATTIDEQFRPLTKNFILGGLALAKANFMLGVVALAMENAEPAISCFKRAAQGYDPSWFPSLMEQVMGAWSIVLFRKGELEIAFEKMFNALRTAAARHSYPGLSYMMPAAAYFLASQGQVERAMELYGLVSEKTIYGNTPWLEDVVGKRIKELAEALPSDVAQAAVERGRNMDLFETAAKLLEEFNQNPP